MKNSNTYSVVADENSHFTDELNCDWAKFNGNLVEIYYKSEDETDAETIEAGFCRVEVADGHSIMWASVYDLKDTGVDIEIGDVCL